MNTIALTLSLFFLLPSPATPARKAPPPAQCVPGKTAPPAGFYRWPAGTQVTVVYKRRAFTPAEKAALTQAVGDWDAILSRLGSRSRLAVSPREAEAHDYGEGHLFVMRSAAYEPVNRHVAFITPTLRPEAGEALRSAVINIDFRVRKGAALRAVLAHEIAHSFGLWDCPGCGQGASLMSKFKNVNGGHKLGTLSPCDLMVLGAALQ